MFAMDYIRRYGFDERFQANCKLEYGHAMDKFKTDQDVEAMMTKLAKDTRELLNEQRSFLYDLSATLNEKDDKPKMLK